MQNVDTGNGYFIDKFLIPRVRLKCPLHKKEQIMYICTDQNCNKQSIICSICKQEDEKHYKDHKNYIKTLDKYIVNTTSDIENYAKGARSLLNEIFTQSENQGLQKWQEEGDMHLKKVENHLEAQKVLLGEDISNVMQMMGDVCQKIKFSLFNKIDEFLQHYKDSFMNYKQILEENFVLAKHYQYYNNPNNLSAKLQSELPGSAAEFVHNLQKAIDKAKLMNSNRTTFISSIKKMSLNLNKMTDNLPIYTLAEKFDGVCSEVGKNLEQFFMKQLNIFEYKDMLIEKDFLDIKKNNITYSILNDNKNLLLQSIQRSVEDVILKPLKKFQLDVPITSMTALSDKHLALSSSHDTKLRIFESEQKKIHSIFAHKEPITFLTKLITEERFMQDNKENASAQSSGNNNGIVGQNIVNGNGNGGRSQSPPNQSRLPNQKNYNDVNQLKKQYSKKVLIVSCSIDQTICLWHFDYDMKQQPIIYQKLTGFSSTPTYLLDLQDNITIVTGDSQGEIIIWDYHKSKILHSNKDKHQQKIIGIILVKKYEKFIVASEDNFISVWKMKYNHQIGLPSIPESFQCEQLITDFSFGSISSIALTIKDLSIIFIGNKEGQLKIYDFVKKKILGEITVHQKCPILDMSLIEDNNSQHGINMHLLSLGLGDKYVKLCKVNIKEGMEEATIVGSKLDVSIYNDDNISKSKIQILKGGISPKLIIANEKEKELLVYEVASQ